MKRCKLTILVGFLFVFGSIVIQGAGSSPEFESLLRDRPQISEVLANHDSLRQWLERAFNGEMGNRKLLWGRDEGVLADGSLGKHSYEDKGVMITISDGPTPIDQLTILVYECVNSRYETSYKALFEAATKGEITREKFSLGAMQIEHQACLVVQDVLREHLSLSEQETAGTEAYRRILKQPKNFDDFIARYSHDKRPEFDAVAYYRSVYDSLSVQVEPKRKVEGQ